jgi:hypothetical protein
VASRIFRIAAGSTEPPLEAVLIDGQGQIVNLAGATATFSLFDLGGAARFTVSATIVSDPGGHVRHAWSSGQTSTAGRYLGRFSITYSNMEVEHFPEYGYIQVIIGTA